MKLFRFPVAVTTFIFIAGVLLMGGVCSPRASAADLPAAVTSELEALEKKRIEALAEARKPLTDLADSYVTALERAKIVAQAAGDLRKILAAEEEIKRVKSGARLDEALEDPEMPGLRRTYTGHLAKREVEVLGKVVQVERRHADSLADVVKELTRAGMIAEAKHVLGFEQAARESIKQLDARNIALSTSRALNAQGVPEGFALIPAGKFRMGDHLDGDQSAPVHTVDVSAFFMAKHAVTKALWDKVREWGLENGYTDLPDGGGRDPDHPVHSINWYAAVKWCNARSEMEKLKPCYMVDNEVYKLGEHNNATCDWSTNGYRLPTEAEWEKAARGGLKGKRFTWGDTISHNEANFNNNGNEPYQKGTRGDHPEWVGSSPATSPVGSFPPNGFGLYDMAGNAFNFCWDWHSSSSYVKGAADPRGVDSGSNRVIRGGSWYHDANNCRTAARNYSYPTLSDSYRGFRPARSSVP